MPPGAVRCTFASLSAGLALLIALPLAAACRTAAQGVVQPSERNVVAFVEHGERVREDVLWVRNRSSVPVAVLSVTLRECENVGLPCGEPNFLFVRVEPGERKEVLRIRPAEQAGPFRYEYAFAWRPADPEDPMR